MDERYDTSSLKQSRGVQCNVAFCSGQGNKIQVPTKLADVTTNYVLVSSTLLLSDGAVCEKSIQNVDRPTEWPLRPRDFHSDSDSVACSAPGPFHRVDSLAVVFLQCKLMHLCLCVRLCGHSGPGSLRYGGLFDASVVRRCSL